MRKTINEKVLRSLRPPTTGRLVVRDVVVPGLRIRVTPRGAKSWSVVYKIVGERTSDKTGRARTGAQHRITLGRYPAMPLSEARERAREVLDAVSHGRDPRPERRQRALNTLASVARRHAGNGKAIRVLERHVLPVLGNRPIRDIRRKDIHELLDDIVESGRVGTARECRKHLSRLFNLCVNREIVSSNPAHRMDRADLASNKDAGRSLTNEELRAIWKATGLLGYRYGSYCRIMILTGQRRGEWSDASWPEIDAQQRLLEIPAERHKSRRGHVVPLVGAAWEIVEGLPHQSGDYIFSNRDGRVPISYFSRAKKRLDRLAPVAPYRLHDFRVSCETRLATLGVHQEIRDAVLGHAPRGLQRIYNKHSYLDEKREALGVYGEHMMEVVK